MLETTGLSLGTDEERVAFLREPALEVEQSRREPAQRVEIELA
jgi:hypothetical protein